MARMNYAGYSGIVIDVCRAHGIWLDHDEMRQIIEFIRSGGLQRAHEIEMEKLEDARRRAGGEPPEHDRRETAYRGPLHQTTTSDERVNLLCGIAWLVSLFL